MLPWIIGGIVVLVGVAMSASEEEARKESEKKLQKKQRQSEQKLHLHIEKNRENQVLELLKVLRQELKLLQKEKEKAMQLLNRSPKGSNVYGKLKVTHRGILSNIEMHRNLIERQKEQILMI